MCSVREFGAAGDRKNQTGAPTVAGAICARLGRHRFGFGHILKKYRGAADSARHGAARARRREGDRAVTHRHGDVRGNGEHFAARCL